MKLVNYRLTLLVRRDRSEQETDFIPCEYILIMCRNICPIPELWAHTESNRNYAKISFSAYAPHDYWKGWSPQFAMTAEMTKDSRLSSCSRTKSLLYSVLNTTDACPSRQTLAQHRITHRVSRKCIENIRHRGFNSIACTNCSLVARQQLSQCKNVPSNIMRHSHVILVFFSSS